MQRLKTIQKNKNIKAVMFIAFLITSLTVSAQKKLVSDLPGLAEDKNSEVTKSDRSMDLETMFRSSSPDIIITSDHVSRLSGTHHYYMRQAINGIEVYGTESSIHLDRQGETIMLHNKLVPDLASAVRSSAPSLTGQEAIQAVAAQMGYNLVGLSELRSEGGIQQKAVYNNGNISGRDIPVKLIYYYRPDLGVAMAWELSVMELDSSDWWNFYVDVNSGAIINKDNFTASCRHGEHEHDHVHGPELLEEEKAVAPSMVLTEAEAAASAAMPTSQYRVYAMPVESPNHGTRSLVDDPDDATASPFGWHSNGSTSWTVTRGNNVRAREDKNANNAGGISPDAGSSLVFDYTLDLDINNNGGSEAAAITNLFYWNNIIHDVMYYYGFDPDAGNFQENNNGAGGVGGDSVNADAQDGLLTGNSCNANFATPADGSNPRMQMYICGTRDGDLDNGVIVHEYGHGISTRLVGGPASVFTLNNDEQMGEGWSDIYGLLFTMEPGDTGADQRGIGTWLIGEGATGPGIRTYPYSTDFGINSLTYNDINTEAKPHGVGAVWSATLWDLTWLLIDQYGFSSDFYTVTGDVNNDAGNIQALALITEGLKLTTASPGFEDGRDAIIAADASIYGGANECLIWQAFAQRGMGYSGDQGLSSSTVDGTSAFDMPPAAGGFDNSISIACLGDGTVLNQNGGYPSGGTYSGPGVTDTGDDFYDFDPVAAGGIGTYDIFYTVNDYCNGGSSTVFTQTIDVQDDSLALSCPGDMVVDADSNDACTAIVVFDYPVPAGDFCNRSPSNLTQNTDLTVTNALNCPSSPNGHIRYFDLNAMGINRDYYIDGIDVGISTSTGSVPLVANIYLASQISGAITSYNFPISSYEEPYAATSSVVPAMSNTIYTIPLEAYLPAGSQFYVEVIAPSSVSGLVGYNSSGTPPANETATGYIGSNNCGISSYVTPASIGFGELAALISVSGSESNEYTTTQISGPSSGSTFSAGSTTLTFQTTSDTQGTQQCSFNVIVRGKPTVFADNVWTPTAPAAGSHVIFSEDYNTDTDAEGDVTACTCEIEAGATVTVEADNYLDIYGDIDVDGTLVVEHQGSVVQTIDDASVANNGTINVNLTTPDLASRDFMILGSPMTAETRTDVWGSAFLVLNHTTANFVPNPTVEAQFPGAENFADDNYDNWGSYSGAINPGEGYIVRPQSGFGQPGGIFNYTYDTGTLNTGLVEFDVIFNGTQNGSPNVAANPYPSAIDADLLMAANPTLEALYFWEHLQAPSPVIPGAGAMNFSMENISFYNDMGGTAATITQFNLPTTTSSAVPNQYVATGQGFGFKANAAGTLVFNNSMRVAGNNNTLRSPQERDRIWLGFKAVDYDMYRTALIGFTEQATAGHDPRFDAKPLATVLSLFSHLEDGTGKYGIQGREAFESGIKVPLGIATQIDTYATYEVSIDNLEGDNLEAATVYLLDNLTQEIHNLSAEPYVFYSSKGVFNNRFTLLFEADPVLSTPDLEYSIALYPNPTEGMVYIYSSNSTIQQIKLYDVLGREVKHIAQVNDLQLALDLSDLNQAVYLLQIQTEAGTVTKQIIKN